jgi:hypothetical protein
MQKPRLKYNLRSFLAKTSCLCWMQTAWHYEVSVDKLRPSGCTSGLHRAVQVAPTSVPYFSASNYPIRPITYPSLLTLFARSYKLTQITGRRNALQSVCEPRSLPALEAPYHDWCVRIVNC